jgi:hypothetical protein
MTQQPQDHRTTKCFKSQTQYAKCGVGVTLAYPLTQIGGFQRFEIPGAQPQGDGGFLKATKDTK